MLREGEISKSSGVGEAISWSQILPNVLMEAKIMVFKSVGLIIIQYS